MKKLILIFVMLVLLFTPVRVSASSNPGNYDPTKGHEMCPVHKNCYHHGW